MFGIGLVRNCGGAPPIASVGEVFSGSVGKSIKRSPWVRSATGDEFRDGDLLRTSREGSVHVLFRNGPVLRLGPSTILQFGRKLGLIGDLQNDSDKVARLILLGEDNVVRLEPGAKISIRTRGAKQVFEVLVGTVVLETREGEFTLEAGQSRTVTIGVPTFTPIADDGGVPIDAGVPDARPSADAAPAPLASAVTARVSGSGVKVRAVAGGPERTLGEGTHELGAGSLLSVRGSRTKVSFERGGERAELVGSGSAIIGSSEAPIISISSGRGTATAQEVAVAIEVPGGRVTAKPGKGRGTDVDVDVRQKTKVTPKSGRVEVVSTKARESIQIGEHIEISKNGDLAVFGRAPKVADFSISAGESTSVHDPGGPTALRVRFESKCADGVVEWKSRGATRSVRGPGSGIALLKRGSHSYSVRCIIDGDEQAASVASGRVSIDGGSGTKPLPRDPPHNIIDATGEDVTIRYQNLLPDVTVRWPNAKEDGRYKLHVKRSSSSDQVYETKGASHRVKNLREGSYRFWFEGDGTRSKEGVLTISFDNAATAGYIRRPKVGASWPGEQPTIEGAGVPGTKVSVGGTELDLDSQGRFKVSVPKPSNEEAIAIKFDVPGQGSHYYVRRNGRR